MADVPQAMKTAYELNHESRVRLLQTGRDALKKIAPTGINATWAPQKRKLTQLITSEQETIAGRMTIAAIDTLAEQGEWIPTGHFINPAGFAGLAFNSDVETVLDVPARTFKETFWKTGSYYQAYRTARDSLDRLIRTITADTERATMGTSVAIRPGVGYVRMVNMPACSRCIILAGKYFRWNEGFLRHPNCDCVHVPTKAKDFAQAQEMGLANDPYEVFKSLSSDMQERLFGRYGAEAIRDGADIFQVVNAQLNKKGAFTTYGTTRRAYAGARLKPNQRRQLPETIYKLAKGDRASAIKVLEEQGYILPVGQIPTGAIRGQALGFGQYGKGGAARGASDAVSAALRSEVRDPSSIYTMTASERRLFEARRDFLFVQQGINPYSEFALRLRGAPLISRYDKPLTPAIAAEVEKRYFIASQANGDAVKMRALYRDYAGVSLSATEVEGLFALASAEQIVLQAASKKVRQIHKSVDLAEVNRRKAEALARAKTANAGGGGRKPPPPRKRSGSNDHPEDPNSERNKHALRKIAEVFGVEGAAIRFADSIGMEEFKQFKKELSELDLSEPAMRVSIYGATKTVNGVTQYLGGHYYYSDSINKSLYPEHWDETTILKAVEFVRQNPIAAFVTRNTVTGEITSYGVRGVYDGVIINIEWSKGKVDRPLHVFPLYGAGVKIRTSNGILKEVSFVRADWIKPRLL